MSSTPLESPKPIQNLDMPSTREADEYLPSKPNIKSFDPFTDNDSCIFPVPTQLHIKPFYPSLYLRSFDQAWNSSRPSTFPIVYLPYAKSHVRIATSLSDLLEYVHFKGAGAKRLERFIIDELSKLNTDEEKAKLERKAFVHWPFNVTKDGYWKTPSGLLEGELDEWKKLGERLENRREED